MEYLQKVLLVFVVLIITFESKADDKQIKKVQQAAPGTVLYEVKKELGCGFFDVRQSIKMDPDFWEAVGHFGYLYYQQRELSQTSEYSIAPSCKFAVYQDGPTGSILAYDVKDNKIITLQQKSLGFTREFRWREDDSKIEIIFDQKDNESDISKVFELPVK